MSISGKLIRPDFYFIAEIGVNHEGSLTKAKELVQAAKEGGADAAKFQTYKSENLAVADSPAYWDLRKESTRSQRELFAKYDGLTIDDYFEIADFCVKLDIDFASTPFDIEAVDALYPLLKYYKIASADINNYELIKKIGRKGIPIILSSGASTLDEISRAISWLQEENIDDITVLHCILNYPTSNSDVNLRMMESLKVSFPEIRVGYSDHSTPDGSTSAAFCAYVLGARIIEKHFTLDKSLNGNDHYHAFDKEDLKQFFEQVHGWEEKLGASHIKHPLPSEEPARKFARRSLVAKKDIEPGHLVTEVDITAKRPGDGIAAERYMEFIGRIAKSYIPLDTKLEDWMFESS